MTADKKTILDECDNWAPMPAWAPSHPDMTPSAFMVFGLLILWSDKTTGLTYNVKRSTIAEQLGLSIDTVDRALKVLTRIGCVTIVKNPRAVLDANGQPAFAKNGKPAVWWGPSQYRVSLKTPEGGSRKNDPISSRGNASLAQGVAAKTTLGWPQNTGGGSRKNGVTNQEPFIKSPSSTSGAGGAVASAPAPASPTDDEIEAGLTIAARRRVEEKILSGTTIRNQAGYQRTTKENLREEYADLIEDARRLGWSRNELADKIAPAPYVEPVAKGAGQMRVCPEHRWMDRDSECAVLHMNAEEAAAFDANPFHQRIGRTYAECVARVRKQLEDFGEPVSLPEVGASQAYAERSQRAMAIVGCLQDVCGENYEPGCHMLFNDWGGDADELRRVAALIECDVTPTTILEYLATARV